MCATRSRSSRKPASRRKRCACSEMACPGSRSHSQRSAISMFPSSRLKRVISTATCAKSTSLLSIERKRRGGACSGLLKCCSGKCRIETCLRPSGATRKCNGESTRGMPSNRLHRGRIVAVMCARMGVTRPIRFPRRMERRKRKSVFGSMLAISAKRSIE